MEHFETLTYEVSDRIARITLNRPDRGNGVCPELTRDLMMCVERADLDPAVHVIGLSGNGPGFCGGYDLVVNAEGESGKSTHLPEGSPLDPAVIKANHDPANIWDPMIDYQMISRDTRAFMSLFHAQKPVVCKVHGFAVAAGTDMALCSDLLIIGDDAKIGYPPVRVWGCPQTAMWSYRLGPQRAKRLLFTGDSLNGTEAVEWGLAIESAPPEILDERFEILLRRIANVPINQLIMMKMLVNQTLLSAGLQTTQMMANVFDGITRHSREGYAFQGLAEKEGFREAVRQRDEAFGDLGRKTFKG